MTQAAQFQRSARRETIFRVAIIGIFGLATVAWLIAGVFQTPSTPDNFTNGYSASPGGHHAFLELLKQNGRTVRQQAVRLALPEFDGARGETLMVLEPRPAFIEEFGAEVEDLLTDAQTRHSSVVLVLAKRAYHATGEDEDGSLVLAEEIFHPGDQNELMQWSGLERWFEVRHDTRPSLTVTGTGPISGRRIECEIQEPVQVLKPLLSLDDLPSYVEIIARTDRDDVVALRLRADASESRGGLIVVSDPDMFSNRYLGDQGMADMAMLMLEASPPAGEIVIDEALHGFGADASLEYLAATPPGLWLTLSVLLALALFGWRQGTVLRPLAAQAQDRGERRYAIEGVARMMERAGQHTDAASRILKRSTLVLGQGGAVVQEAGKVGTSMIRKGTRQRVRMQGENAAERLINVARRVAEQKRAGETGGTEVWSD